MIFLFLKNYQILLMNAKTFVSVTWYVTTKIKGMGELAKRVENKRLWNDVPSPVCTICGDRLSNEARKP